MSSSKEMTRTAKYRTSWLYVRWMLSVGNIQHRNKEIQTLDLANEKGIWAHVSEKLIEKLRSWCKSFLCFKTLNLSRSNDRFQN